MKDAWWRSSDRLAHAERRQQPEHEHPRHEPADEQVLDGDVLRDDGVEDERDGQREEQPQRTGRRQQSDGEAPGSPP